MRLPHVVELGVYSLGSSRATPFLFAILDDGDVYVYRSFFFSDEDEWRRSKMSVAPVRWQRVTHGLIFRHLRGTKTRHRKNEDSKYTVLSTKPQRTVYPRLIPFDNVGGKRGVFLLGQRPVWIFCERDALRFHPMSTFGNIMAFTPFHHCFCPFGFVCYTAEHKLHLCTLNPAVSTELSLLHACHTFDRSLHRLVYHPKRQLIVAVTSTRKEDMRLYLRKYKEETVPDEATKKEGDDESNVKPQPSQPPTPAPPPATEPSEDLSTLPPRMPPVSEEKYKVDLLTADTRQQLDEFPLIEKDREVALTLRLCYLKTKEHEDAAESVMPILVVGTALLHGEDYTTKGRLLLFDIIQVQSELANQADVLKLKLLYEKELKGPISAVAAVEGYLLVCIGSKLILYQLQNKRDLNAIAFYDAQMYITELHVVKNYILVADLYKSVYLLRWKAHTRSLTLLSKDLDRVNVVSAALLIDDMQLTFVCADIRQNLHLYQYQPTNPVSRGGQKLVAVGSFHLGSQAHTFLRLKLNKVNLSTKDKNTSKEKDQESSTSVPSRYCLYYGSLDGSVGYLTPLSEADFRRLGRLEMRLVSELSHCGGLNPKAYRLIKPLWPLTHNHIRRVVDGELLWQFLFLDRTQQYELTRLIGSTPEEIVDLLLTIDLTTHFF
jgi:cleavage and polyadenylation specificity factor subunit 1